MAFFFFKYLTIFVILFIEPGTGQLCPNHKFLCLTSVCISMGHMCSPSVTCDQQELDCNGNCTADEFECQSGSCIPLHMKCNRRYDDCNDGDDEFNCPITEGCRYHEFQCLPSMICLPNIHMCDTNVCSADEVTPVCDGNCKHDEFQCQSGACIPQYYRCDRAGDCRDGDDEDGCLLDDYVTDINGCSPHQLNCDGRCTSISSGCAQPWCHVDFAGECFGDCGPDEYQCRSGYCLPQQYVCDGWHDCFDFDDDEANCTSPAPGTDLLCPNHKFMCRSDLCIPTEVRCSVVDLCDNDEVKCNGNCAADEFQCQSGACIPLYMKCNRRFDCADEDDEINCTNSEGCRYHKFQCYPSMTCQYTWQQCEPNVCPAGDVTPVCDGNCAADQFQCQSGACIPQSYYCDQIWDCNGGDDETGCLPHEYVTDINNCSAHQFACHYGTCVAMESGCTESTCHLDFAGECFGECGPDEYQCLSGYCLPQQYVCDGWHDCFDFDDDEANCTSLAPVITSNCTTSGVSASLPGSYVRSLLPGAGEQLEMIGDDSTPLNMCFAVKDNQTDEYYMNFSDGIGQCSANMNESDTDIVVTYKVSLGVAADPSSQVITRNGGSAVVVFQCAYNRSGIATMEQPLLAMISHVVVDLGKTASAFTMEMARYTSDSFTAIETEQTITIGSPVYIGVNIDVQADTNLVLQGIDCILADAESLTETVYPVVIGGCAAPDPLDADGNVVYNVTDSRKFDFSFLGFRWFGVRDSEQEIWLLCRMNICEKTDDNDCKIDCPSIPDLPVKRSITDETNDATKKISLGPFVLAPEPVRDDQLTCHKEELGCSHMCGIDTTGVAYCYCSQGYFLMKDGKTCIEVNRGIKTLMEVSLLPSLCLMMMLIILILTVVMLMKKKNVGKIVI